MEDLNSIILVIELNANGLNISIKVQRLSDWLKGITQLHVFPRNPLYIDTES